MRGVVLGKLTSQSASASACPNHKGYPRRLRCAHWSAPDTDPAVLLLSHFVFLHQLLDVMKKWETFWASVTFARSSGPVWQPIGIAMVFAGPVHYFKIKRL